MPRLLLSMGAVAVAVLGLAVFAQAASVTPSEVSETLEPGDSVTIEKTVQTDDVPAKPDVYFLADTTGSMFSVIDQVQTDAAAVLADIDSQTTDPRYGAGDYKDFPHDPYAFRNEAAILATDDDGAAALTAIGDWAAGGGADGSEGQLYALDQIADPGDPTGVDWRPDATRIVVWFGDAPGHDPVCSDISGLGYDIDEASATAKLTAAGIQVIAISTLTGFAEGLDDDPTLSAGDYAPFCDVIDGSSGQATRIAAATGGVHLTDVPASAIADAILEGIGSLSVTITPVPVGCDPLDISFDPGSQTVDSGDAATFSETIAVPSDVDVEEVDCTVEFRDGSGAVIATQDISIDIPLEVPAAVDVHPTSCPNPLNVAKGGLVPAAIVGSADFDASEVDPRTVTLEGVAPIRSALEDVAGVYTGGISEPPERDDCTTAGPDGIVDMTLKFDAERLAAALGPVSDGDVVVATLSGELLDGTPFTGQDVLWIVKKGGGRP